MRSSSRSIEGRSPGEHTPHSAWTAHSTHPIPDSIILGAESETNYSDHDVDLRAGDDSGLARWIDGELTDDGFGSRTKYLHASGRLAQSTPR